MICNKIDVQKDIVRQNLEGIKDIVKQYNTEAFKLFGKHGVACSTDNQHEKLNIENEIRIYMGNYNMILESLERMYRLAENNSLDSSTIYSEIDELVLDCITTLTLCKIIVG